MNAMQLIENWHVLRMVVVAGMLFGFVAIVLAAGWVSKAAPHARGRRPLPRIAHQPTH